MCNYTNDREFCKFSSANNFFSPFYMQIVWCSWDRQFVNLIREQILHGRTGLMTSPPASDPVGIENCKQLFPQLLAFTTQKLATRRRDIISAVFFFLSWMQAVMKNINIYFFFFFECKSELLHRSAWNRAREPNQESPRACGFVFNTTSFYK